MINGSVTVVIPCYNASRFLRETLGSAIAQTHVPLEILVVDDGSTDDSSEIARSFGPLVRVIAQINQGESVARNRGIEEARGDWIAFLDADDLWSPEKLARQLTSVDSDDVVCVHTNLYYFGDRQGETKLQERDAAVRYSIPQLAVDNSFISPSAMLVRRKASPRFPTWTRYGEDLLYCLELVSRGRIVLVEDPLTGYRQHGSAQSRAASTRIGWHQTMERWLKDNSNHFSSQQIVDVRRMWLKYAIGATWQLKQSRQWDEYWAARQYLSQFGGMPEVDELLRNRIYPRWLYKIRDTISFCKRD